MDAAHLAAQDVAVRIEALTLQGSKSEFSAFGISFGTIFALEAIKQNAALHRLVLVAPFGDFIGHVDAWQFHRFFGKVVRSQQTSLVDSGKVLNKVGMLIQTELLRDKQLLVYLGSSDRIIHTAITERAFDELVASEYAIEMVEFGGGHFSPILRLVTDRRCTHFLAAK